MKPKKPLPLGSDHPRSGYDVIECNLDMRRVKLEVQKFAAQQRFDVGAYFSNMRIEQVYDEAARYMVLRMLQRVATKKLDVKTVRFPADWWQAFKRQFFPAWALARWPVKYEEVTMEANAYYPDVAIPDRDAFVEIVMLGREAGRL